MKRVTLGFCIAAILGVASSFGQNPPTDPRSISNSIEVLVKTSSGSPLADVDVIVSSKPAAPVTTTNARTGSDGRAILRNLPAGAFDVRIERQGYMAIRSGGNFAGSLTVSVQLGSPTQSTTRYIKAILTGGGIISGKVEGPTGRPSAGVPVAAMQVTYQVGRKVLSEAGAISGTAAVRTDDRGEFRIFWLAPGDYYLRVDSAGPRNEHSYVASVFYPGTTNPGAATRIAVREGQESGGLRFVQAPPDGVKLSGTVTNTIKDAKPYQIILTPEAALSKPQWIGFSQDPNDNDSEFPFEIFDVPPGNYELLALVRVSEPDNQVTYLARTRVAVGSQDLRNITMTVRQGGDLRGSVSISPEVQSFLRELSGRPGQQQALHITFQPEVSSDIFSSVQFESSEFENNRITFSESNVIQSRYRLARISPIPFDAYIGDVKQNGQTTYDGVVDVGENAVDVQVSVGRNGGTIQGVVTTQLVDVPNYVAVVLVPDEPRRRNLLLYKRQEIGGAPADPTLFRFSFVGVAPGNYRVIAVDSLQRESEMDPEVFARYESRAIAVVVTAGATRELQVPLIQTR